MPQGRALWRCWRFCRRHSRRPGPRAVGCAWVHDLAQHPRRLQVPPAENAACRLRVHHSAKSGAFVVGTKLHAWKLARTVRSACTLFQLRQICFSEPLLAPCSTSFSLPEPRRRALLHYYPFSAMTKQEKQRLAAVLRATEYLFLENIALKLVLEHREVSNWQRLLEHLLADREMLAGVRLKFKDLYAEIEGSKDPSGALEAFLGELPRRGKPH